MNWPGAAIVGIVLVVFLVFRRMALVPAGVARKQLAGGALIIDVRSPEEYGSGHVRGAVNIPLGELRINLPRWVGDKNQVLLLYCQGGGRSSIAKRQARDLGYAKAFNLGSLGRARKIVEGTPGS